MKRVSAWVSTHLFVLAFIVCALGGITVAATGDKHLASGLLVDSNAQLVSTPRVSTVAFLAGDKFLPNGMLIDSNSQLVSTLRDSSGNALNALTLATSAPSSVQPGTYIESLLIGTNPLASQGNTWFGAEQNFGLGASNNTSGSGENTCIGTRACGGFAGALASSFNTAVGHDACGIGGSTNANGGHGNICIGTDAGRNISGSTVVGNVIVGSSAGENVTKCCSTLVGDSVGGSISTASRVSLFGQGCDDAGNASNYLALCAGSTALLFCTGGNAPSTSVCNFAGSVSASALTGTCSATLSVPCAFTWTCTMSSGVCTTTQAVPASSRCTVTPGVSPRLSSTNVVSVWVTLASTTLTINVSDMLLSSSAAFSGNGECL